MKYKASLDKLAKGLTIGVILFIAVIFSIEFIFNSVGLLSASFGFGITCIFLLLCYLYAPKSYTLNETNLTINKVAGKVEINLKDITSVQRITKFEGGTVRTFGSGGFLGYYGKFYNSKIGKLNMYVTRSDNKILLKMNDGRNIVISPDDLSLFDELNSRLHKS